MKTRKLIAMLLSLAMVIGLMTPAAMAEESNATTGNGLPEATNGVITLTEDVTLDAPYTVAKGTTLTIDLAGKKLTYNSTTQGEAMITNKGTLTIDDTVGDGEIYYNYTGVADSSYSKGNYTISNGGTLIVNDGKITIANLRAHAKYPIDNNSTSGDAVLVINGGHLYNYNTSAIRQFCNSTTNENSVTINGGLIEGYCAIWVQNPGSKTVNGQLSITGGEIKTTAAAYVNGTAELEDVSSAIYCTIDANGGAWSADSYVSLTGGIFNENVSLVEEAPVVMTGEDATFNGRLDIPAPPVAQIGGSYYSDLETAVAAAQTGDTIKLLENVALTDTDDSIEVADKTVTVNLNGKDVTAQGDAFVVTGTGHLILKDTVGTSDIKGGQAGVGSWTAVWAHHGGKVTIQGGSYCVGGDANTSDTTHQNDCIYAGSSAGLTAGTIIVEGGTFTNSDNMVWPLNMKDGSASSITVVGGTFDGWNPAEAYTEPAPARPTSFVPTGYYVKEVDGTYTVHNNNTIVGKTVTLDGDITVPNGGIVVNADTTINLNGKTVSALSDTFGDGVFHVVSGGVLTINGEGTIDGVGNNNYSMAIWADGGKVVINGGTYTNVGAGEEDHYDLIYAKNGGSVEINGGTFTCQTPFWTLNKNDQTNGTITVKGGTFTGYNPSVSNTENPTANFVATGYEVEQSGENYVVSPCEYIVAFDANGGSVTPATATATHDVAIGTLPTPTRDGYTFNGWFDAVTDGNQVTTSTVFTGDTTVYAQWTKIVSGGGGSSSGGASSATTGKGDDGIKVTVTAAAANAAAKKDEPVTLPVEVEAAESTEKAVEISVNVPKSGAKVEIPVENVTPGTVVIIVNADGTESIVPLTTLTEDGVVVTLEDDATIKVVDNSKDFVDVPDEYALADSIDFVSARGLFEGTTETTFTPHANTTIAQTMTVLARLSGENFYGAGSTTKGAEWATEKGLSDGTDVSKAITREQMVVMMWKLAGMPESDQVLTASDVNDISADALTAMQWAVEMGILKGNLDGTLNPNGNASRAHVAAFAERYVNVMAK